MTDYAIIATDLEKQLKLEYAPVGITLYGSKDEIPSDLSLTDAEYKSYCHALVAAGQGQTLLLKNEQMGCKLGTSVLGFEKDIEAYLDDGVLEKYGVGLFASEEASAATILQ